MTDSENEYDERLKEEYRGLNANEIIDKATEKHSKSDGGLPTAAIVDIDAESGYPFADITDYGYHLRKGDELVRRSDVKALIQERLEKAEEKVEKYNGLDRLNLNDAKARKQEIELLLDEIEGEASE